MLRFSLAVTVALIVSGISLHVAWGNAAAHNECQREQYLTQNALNSVADGIADYNRKFGTAPKSRKDLEKIYDTFPLKNNGQPTDGWGHPLVFLTNATSLVVTSYGRDGKPGGMGLDCDLTTENWNPKEARMTLFQFLQEKATRRMVVSCLICGGFAGLLSFLMIKLQDLNRCETVRLVFELFVTILFSVFIALIIAALHLPAHEH